MYSIIQKLKTPTLLLIAVCASTPALAQTGSANKPIGEDTTITSIGDVVIVGYGRQSRRNLVGSISTVNGKEITDMPAPSFEAALQGKAAGDRKSTRLNSSHIPLSRMPSSA